MSLSKKEAVDVIAAHALMGVLNEGDTMIHLHRINGERDNSYIYKSDIPYSPHLKEGEEPREYGDDERLWMLSNGVGIADVDLDLDALAQRNGIFISRTPARRHDAAVTHSELKLTLQRREAELTAANLKNRMTTLKSTLEAAVADIEVELGVRYTGNYVFLRRAVDRWESVGIFDPDTWDGEIPEWEVCLPIPVPETIKDWSGW